MTIRAKRILIPLSRRRKFVYSCGTLTIFVFSAELVLMLMGFENPLHTRDPYLGFSQTSKLFSLDQEQGVPVFRTVSTKHRYFNPQAFVAKKPTGTKRVFCLGGSTTFGRPFDDRTSYVNWLRKALPSLDASFDWEVINVGGISYASYRLLNLVEELSQYEPDLLIVYTGHNEFLERRTYGRAFHQPSWATSLFAPLHRTRLVGAVDQFLLSRNRKNASIEDGVSAGKLKSGLQREVDAILDHSVGPDAYNLETLQSDQIHQHFEYNLRRIIKLARAADTPLILVTPASNQKDFSPFKSQHSRSLTATASEQWNRHFSAAKSSYRGGDLVKASLAISEAESIDPNRADLQFIKGNVLFDQMQYSEADACFKRAVELDVCPLRAKREIEKIVLELAIEYQTPLVDFPTVLRSHSLEVLGYASLGEDYFLDHVHPTVASHGMLAGSILDAMRASGWLNFSDGAKEAALRAVAKVIDAGVDAPLQAKALTNLAQVLSWAGKQTEAAPLAAKAVEIQQGLGIVDPESLFYAATQYAVDGQDEVAIEMLRKLVQHEPEHQQARWRLASLLYDSEAFAESIDHLRMLHEFDSSDLFAERLLGFALLRNDQRREAAEIFRSYLLAVPQDASVLKELRRIELANQSVD